MTQSGSELCTENVGVSFRDILWTRSLATTTWIGRGTRGESEVLTEGCFEA